MSYKAIFVDVDGTLMCSSRKFVTKATAAALKSLQDTGVLLIAATGRSFPAIRPEVLGGLIPDYCVCCNGANVVDKVGKPIFQQYMSLEQINELINLFEVNNYSLGFAFSDGYYNYINHDAFAEFYMENNGDMDCMYKDHDRTHHLTTMPFSAYGLIPPDKAAEFNTHSGDLYMVPFKECSFDICQKSVNKSVGAEVLLKTLGLPWESVVAIGDGENDIALIKKAGLGIAMGNASKVVQASADFVTDTVLNGGVEKAVSKFF